MDEQAPAPASQVLLLCPEPLRAQQQGIGLRFREMAEELAAGHRVILYGPNRDLPVGRGHETRAFDPDDVVRELPRTRAVIVQGQASEDYFATLERHGVTAPPPLVCDLYDPFLVENLTYTRDLGPGIYHRDRAVLLRQLARGDRFLVSSRTQMAFYVGLMMGSGAYAPQAPAEARFLVVPFGVRPPPPRAERPRAGGGEVVFFGGIYDWYDPHLLLDAVEELLPRPGLRVLFTRSPSPGTTPQRVLATVEARVARSPALAAHVELIPWLPHAELRARLQGADVAVALHRESLEADISLRTRILEYLACGLPVIATEGGEAATLLHVAGGGRLVAPGDRAGLRDALRELLDDAGLRRRLGARGGDWVLRHMTWAQTLAPLSAYLREAPAAAAAPAARAAPAASVAAGDTTPFFSVVVATFNGRRFLPDCLASIEAGELPPARYEIIVADNASTDGSRELIGERFPRVRVVTLDRNAGFTGGAAAGARAARGEALVFVNNDMRVAPGWLAAYHEAFAAGAVCATGQILDFEGAKIDFVGAILAFDGHGLQRCQGLPAAAFRGLAAEQTFIACGGNMAIRRDLYDRLGGFDLDYFAYSEDLDLSWRLHAAGHGITFVPGALAYHHGQGTSTPALGTYRRGILYETNAFATLYKNIDAPYFDALLHAAWRALVNRTMHILAETEPGARFAGNGAPAPTLRVRLGALRRMPARRALAGSLQLVGELLGGAGGVELRHPHALAQLEALARVLRDVDRLHEKRGAVQALRVRPDAEIFRVFPPWVVDTYPGDRQLFASPAFRAMLPRDIPFRFATAAEVHTGVVR